MDPGERYGRPPKLTNQVSSVANGVNADGSVIVGEALVPGQPIGTFVINESHAVRWTGANAQTVAAWLAANGVAISSAGSRNEGVETQGIVIIGGGQMGLSLGYYLYRAKADFLIHDVEDGPGGAWRQSWNSLRLFLSAGYSALSAWLMPRPTHECIQPAMICST
ncbi:hypothetical protein EGM87_06595 [Sphingobium sp. RSMS]|uniref:hypothetical protein n=1 Tax=Sphingobium sp. RSMS TaxID=520734 RepID=UPI001C0F7FE9|nr:hypothetical protein [Sphingobium sp. RSMS]UXC92134.1 hypothetical protein EGM87_06595 [Sphingobium sp. RSMS]